MNITFAYDCEVGGIYYNLNKVRMTAQVTYKNHYVQNSYHYFISDYEGSVSIPSSIRYENESYDVTSIDKLAFNECYGLSSVNIPNSVTTIGRSAFSDCTGLKSITIPNSVNTIEDYAFYNCDSLTSVNIPNSVTSIGAWAFSSCSGLTSITIPNSVKTIEERTFYFCSSLTSITIPNSVTTIGESAFSSCSGLTSITIPNSVTSIGAWAFNNCMNLHLIICERLTPPSISSSSYSTFPDNDIVVIVPTEVISKYEKASGWSNYIYNQPYSVSSTQTTISLLRSELFSERYAKIGDAEYYPTDSSFIINGLTPNTQYTIHAFAKYKDIEMQQEIKTMTKKPDLCVKALKIGNVGLTICGEFKSDAKILGHGFEGYSEGVDVLELSGLKPGESRTFTYYVTLEDDSIYSTTQSFSTKEIELMINNTKITNTCIELQGRYNVIDVNVEKYGFRNNTVGENTLRRTDLKPGSSYTYTYYVVLEDGSEYNKNHVVSTRPIDLSIQAFANSTSCLLRGSSDNIDATIIESGFVDNEKQTEEVLTGLDPNTNYNIKKTFYIDTKEGGRISKKFDISFTTKSLTIQTLQPKVISVGNVIVAAASNLDDEETNVGFEWRRTDWTNDFASNTGGAYLYDGMMEGYIRNLNAEKLWKFRPYYEAASGNKYYGEWVGLDPSNTSYFEPTVHTYAKISVEGNVAQVKGYVMRGSDNVTQQGFMYWKQIDETRGVGEKALSIPSDAQVIEATGNVMAANLKNLDYESTYCCVAFVKTSENELFYGELQTFQTGVDISGVEEVLAPCVVTEVARYDMRGRHLDTPQRGMNIIRMSDGTVRKVMVR